MSTIDERGYTPIDPMKGDRAEPSLVTWTHVIYALHAASLLVGVASAKPLGTFTAG